MFGVCGECPMAFWYFYTQKTLEALPRSAVSQTYQVTVPIYEVVGLDSASSSCASHRRSVENTKVAPAFGQSLRITSTPGSQAVVT